VLLTALGITAAARSVGPPAGPRVLAMLPFTYSGEQNDGSVLAAGLSGEILTDRLSSLPGFTVVRPAVAEVDPPAESPTELARELGATHVATGTLREGADGVMRAEVALRAAADGAPLWHETYEGTRRELPALHERVARGFISALRRMDQSVGAVSDAARQRLGRPATANVDAFADYSQAQRFLERFDAPGNLDRAVKLFQSAVQKDQQFVQARTGLGMSYWLHYSITKDPSWLHLSREAALAALRIDADSPPVHKLLARIDEGTGRPDRAIVELRRAIELTPNDDEAYRRIGLLYADRGRRKEAEAALLASIRIRPDFWENHRTLGRAYLATGRYADALKPLTRVVELQPDSKLAYQNLGAAYDFLGNYPKALENYEKANAIAPEDSAYVNIGTIHYNAGRLHSALKAFEHASRLTPRDPRFTRRMADVKRRLGLQREARSLYVKALGLCRDRLKLNPNETRALTECAICSVRLGQVAAARRFVAHAVTTNPNDNAAWYLKATVASLSGAIDESEKALRTALEKGASVAEVRQDEDLAVVREKVFGKGI
jgi:tetratricopeptide (TPR) repeat protein